MEHYCFILASRPLHDMNRLNLIGVLSENKCSKLIILMECSFGVLP